MYLTGQTHGSAPTGLLLFYIFVLFGVRSCIITFSARGGSLEGYSHSEYVPHKSVFAPNNRDYKLFTFVI